MRNAHGKGPENVIDQAARQARIYGYDAHAALLDTDILWTDKLKKDARKAKIDMVGSVPCFEGLLLLILGKRPANQCAECKKAIQQLIDVDLTERQAYAKHFSRVVLDAAKLKLVELDRLSLAFEGH